MILISGITDSVRSEEDNTYIICNIIFIVLVLITIKIFLFIVIVLITVKTFLITVIKDWLTEERGAFNKILEELGML